MTTKPDSVTGVPSGGRTGNGPPGTGDLSGGPGERPGQGGRPGQGSGRPRRLRPWRAVFLAPVGDGQVRRRGSDGLRVAVSVVAIVLGWLLTEAGSNAERTIATTLASVPDGVRWAVTATWWTTSLGTVFLLIAITLLSLRWSAARDVGVSAVATWVLTIMLEVVLGNDGGRSVAAIGHFNLAFPAVRMAITTAVVVAALPYLARWLQRTAELAVGLLALSTIASGAGLPVSMLTGLALGWGVVAVVHLLFGSPLGLPSPEEVGLLLADLDLLAAEVHPAAEQEWGVGRFEAVLDGSTVAVSVYGRDAADAQLLAKTARFLFYRDSGPTLTFTRRQQVEHEAYLTMMTERAGVRAPHVLAAGPAGPSNDALLVTQPPAGRAMSTFAGFIEPAAVGSAEEADRTYGGDARRDRRADPPLPQVGAHPPTGPVISDRALDGLFSQIGLLRDARIAHGALSVERIVVDEDDRVGMVDFRMAATAATDEQLGRDLAAALAAAALVAGPDRSIEAALRILPSAAIVDALPFLQRAALTPAAARTLRGKRSLLASLRASGATTAGVDVPKLIEPRRMSWTNVALIAGTVIGGWALIGVLVNVTKSWSTITGARWGWVALVFVLAQAAYPAIAVTTIGSVTDPLPFGRSVALELSDTFVALAGGSMAVLATRVRFFQQEGYSPTVAVSSGVLVSTASWIVKGVLLVIALPLAFRQFDFSVPHTASSGGSKIVWLIVVVVVVVALALGLLLSVPRWRRLAAAKLRPRASEVWAHLKVLASHPRNLVEIFGGSIMAQLLVAFALGAALHAFGDSLSLSTLIVVLTLGSMIGGLSPVPGGMGAVEAGMILMLTAAGVDERVAVAAVFVQRLFTAYLPPIWGWFVMIWMRKREYL
ncbi:MAG: lysylphosphatidylglycerol synthase domain-containing protein [Acidimicrobiales bacterium]